MEKIIQIAFDKGMFVAVTSEGRLFTARDPQDGWEGHPLPPLYTNEIDHKAKGHSCTVCVKTKELLGLVASAVLAAPTPPSAPRVK